VLLNHSFVWVMLPRILIQMSLAGVGTPMWIASVRGCWQRMTKITNDTDYY